MGELCSRSISVRFRFRAAADPDANGVGVEGGGARRGTERADEEARDEALAWEVRLRARFRGGSSGVYDFADIKWSWISKGGISGRQELDKDPLRAVGVCIGGAGVSKE